MLIAMVYAAWRGYAPGVVAAAIGWAAVTAMLCWKRVRVTQKSVLHVLEMIATSALIPPVSVVWRLAGAWRYRVLFL